MSLLNPITEMSEIFEKLYYTVSNHKCLFLIVIWIVGFFLWLIWATKNAEIQKDDLSLFLDTKNNGNLKNQNNVRTHKKNH